MSNLFSYFELELPEYTSKEVFREKLLQAIYEGKEGFHVV
jgi:Ubiquitin-protein ligase